MEKVRLSRVPTLYRIDWYDIPSRLLREMIQTHIAFEHLLQTRPAARAMACQHSADPFAKNLNDKIELIKIVAVGQRAQSHASSLAND